MSCALPAHARLRASALGVLALVAGLSGAGCASRVAQPRPARPRTADMAAYYGAPGPVPVARVVRQAARRDHEVLAVELPARARADAPAVDREPIAMTWHRPRGDGPRPAVLVSPILGNTTDFVEGFCRRFAALGWHGLVVTRPEVVYDESLPLSQVEDRLRASVSRQVQALDWLLEQPGVDPARVGALGVSAGGIQTAMAGAVDPRYAALVIALAGGPMADILVDTSEKDLQRLVERGVRALGVDRKALRDRLRGVIRTDPVALGPWVEPEKVLLVLARRDRSVPYPLGLRLREALGRPATIQLPLGHYTTVVALPFLEGRAVHFLRARFDAVRAGHPPRSGETGSTPAPGATVPARRPESSP